jgi:hypothetical protein
MNGSVVYRYQPASIGSGGWMPGIWFIENHNHLPIYDAPTTLDKNGQHTYMVVPYDVPEKKHVDHAINLLKKAMKDKQLDGLMYVDNYVTLKGYLEEIKESKASLQAVRTHKERSSVSRRKHLG